MPTVISLPTSSNLQARIENVRRRYRTYGTALETLLEQVQVSLDAFEWIALHLTLPTLLGRLI